MCIHLFLIYWQFPEEHDLESQVRKEREWRFLRNARVRKQAQIIIQKGEHLFFSFSWTLSGNKNIYIAFQAVFYFYVNHWDAGYKLVA